MPRSRFAAAAAWFAAQPPVIVVATCLAWVAAIGLVDLLTGPEISISFFFLGAVALATWALGQRVGIAFAFLSAAIWLAADTGAGNVYRHPATPYWNATIRLAFFATFALTLSVLRRTLERERVLARTDSLTGLCNTRWFEEVNRAEHHRAVRYAHPYALLYLDVDGFKAINDTRGHAAGDQLLVEIGQVLSAGTRETDTVARVGGDEFAVLLPETSPAGAELLAHKIEAALREHAAGRWAVGFSIGVAVDCQAAASPGAALAAADTLMYTVKRAGRGGRLVGSAATPHPAAADG